MTLEDVIRALQRPLPGPPAQERMGTRPRSIPAEFLHGEPPREGAVLILLYPLEGQWTLPLTRRTEHVATHKGQISLPGGAKEEYDASPWHTALREATEEIGVASAEVRCLGALSPLYIPPSNFHIHPYVGTAPVRPTFVLDAVEVAELIEMPLATLLDPAAHAEEIRTLRGRVVQVPFYRYQHHVIWGATAMVLSELEVMLAAVLSPTPPGPSLDEPTA
jgi:8-oxo-dGTP pyrophosphatase MutT (NUDIX family)